MSFYRIVAFVLGSCLSCSAWATTETWVGKIYMVQVTAEDASNPDPTGTYRNETVIWVTNKTAAGTCLTTAIDNTTFVGLRLKDDARGQAFLSLVLAARAQGLSVQVSADDTKKDGLGYCYVRYVRIKEGL